VTVETLRYFLGWCSIINIGLLLFWVLWLQLAHDFVYSVHGQLFKLSEERFDALHYSGILHFKICIFLFNIAPYLALQSIG